MESVNLLVEAGKIKGLFQYHQIAEMNGHSFTLIKAESRTLDFHLHEESDEVFLIIEGEMALEFEDEMVHLKQGEMFVVPKGVMHRPVCTAPVTALLIEKVGTLNKQNTGGTYGG